MNIFYLDPNPQVCAEMHCDKHVVKMIIEYAQLMSTAHRVLDGEEYTDLTANGRRIKRWRLNDAREPDLMKASHINHPSGIWCRSNRDNYIWLYHMWYNLCKEYTYRYGKVHSCTRLNDHLYFPPNKIIKSQFYPPTPAMPIEAKVIAEVAVPGRKYDTLLSYHKYYIEHKNRFAKWTKRSVPVWYIEGLNKHNANV
jgi:hypothetical protein